MVDRRADVRPTTPDPPPQPRRESFSWQRAISLCSAHPPRARDVPTCLWLEAFIFNLLAGRAGESPSRGVRFWDDSSRLRTVTELTIDDGQLTIVKAETRNSKSETRNSKLETRSRRRCNRWETDFRISNTDGAPPRLLAAKQHALAEYPAEILCLTSYCQ